MHMADFTQVKEVYATGRHPPRAIFNMDECGFDLSEERKRRRIGPVGHPRNGQALPPSHDHITSVACIGISSAPVPPLIIYQGKELQDIWVRGSCPTRQTAITTESGWIDSWVMLRWLEDVFDPATKDRVDRGQQRLLFMDGHETHVKVAFLEACWSREIVVVILPANLSGRFQPLDVNFFNTLKLHYHRHLTDYQMGSSLISAAKGMFWTWHGMAWRDTATVRQIQSAWRKSGLWPLSAQEMGAEEGEERASPATPPPPESIPGPTTPHSLRILRSNMTGVRQGVWNPTKALEKSNKFAEMAIARIALLEAENAQMRASQQQDKETRGSRKRQRFPVGHVFDSAYREEHASELAERRSAEEAAAAKKKAAARSKGKQKAPNPPRACTPGPSGTT